MYNINTYMTQELTKCQTTLVWWTTADAKRGRHTCSHSYLRLADGKLYLFILLLLHIFLFFLVLFYLYLTVLCTI